MLNGMRKVNLDTAADEPHNPLIERIMQSKPLSQAVVATVRVTRNGNVVYAHAR